MSEFKFPADDRQNLRQWCPDDYIDRLELACAEILKHESISEKREKAGASSSINRTRTSIKKITKRINELLDSLSSADVLTRQQIQETFIDISSELPEAEHSVFRTLYWLQDGLTRRLSQIPSKKPRKSFAQHILLIKHVVRPHGIVPSRSESSPFFGIVETCFKSMGLKNDQGELPNVEYAIRVFLKPSKPQKGKKTPKI